MSALLDPKRKRSRKAKRELLKYRSDSVELVLPTVAFLKTLTASTAKALTDWDREAPGQ